MNSCNSFVANYHLLKSFWLLGNLTQPVHHGIVLSEGLITFVSVYVVVCVCTCVCTCVCVFMRLCVCVFNSWMIVGGFIWLFVCVCECPCVWGSLCLSSYYLRESLQARESLCLGVRVRVRKWSGKINLYGKSLSLWKIAMIPTRSEGFRLVWC